MIQSGLNMGERYQGWLKDQNGRQILTGFHFDDLTEDQQKKFEEIYKMGQDRYDEADGKKVVKALADELNTSVASIKDAIRYLENLGYTIDVKGGTDPHVFERGQHHKGLSEV